MHVLNSSEGKGRGARGKKGRYSNLTRGNKKSNNGGFTDLWVSSSQQDNDEFYKSLCDKEGHRYNPSTGLCVRCYSKKED